MSTGITLLEKGDLQALSAALRSGEVSAQELAKNCLDAVSDSQINAFLDVQPELTLEQARQADARLAEARQRGERTSPLLGVPVAHKDVFVTRGWKSTAGSRMLADYYSPFDATVVRKVREAGAVCIGKLNCDEFAMGSCNENSFFGPVLNPWDQTRVAGGSSGGSAAAVAAGLVPLSTGTDTGGSVRQPAAMCGVTGVKPTYGRVSRYGMIAFASSLDQAGVFARSAADCAQLLAVMAGVDDRDATSLPVLAEDLAAVPAMSWAEGGDLPLGGLRVGIPEEFLGSSLAPSVRQAVEEALKGLEALGAIVVPVSLPHTELAIPAYYVIAPAEASSNLARFDGVRFGHRSADAADLKSLYMNSRAEGFGPEVRRRIMIGTYVLSHGYYDAYYRKAQQLRRLIADDFSRVFQQVDLIAGPVSPDTAWPIGRQVDDPVRNYLADIYTLPASLAGLPGVSLPCGFDEGGLPVGLQLVGPALSEARLLTIGHIYQQVTDWHLRRPGRSVGDVRNQR
ncbi:MAG: Asp-tRNA(Asn)/Glu-tRNA(Gln) amidotransferase subunit GatA [Lautropia sp.]|nr:Asp-tRNA(Asn)/Glu-tRNA(Gln) amidotransferase subunit GatA [Lautropia sp.]